MKLSLKLEADALSRELATFAFETRQSVAKTLRQRSGHVARELAYVTGPFGLDSKTKAKIENSIRTDLLGGVKRAGEKKQSALFYSAPLSMLRKWHYESPQGIVRTWATKEGKVYGTESTLYRPNAGRAEMRKHHKRYFKNGRRSRAGTFTREIGRWKFIDKMVVGKGAMNDYLRWVLLKVGWSKAGWITAAMSVGGVIPRSGRLRVPKWVSRHANKSPGRGTDRTSHPAHPYIILRSQVPWVSKQIDGSAVARALHNVRQNLAKQIDHIVQAESRKV